MSIEDDVRRAFARHFPEQANADDRPGLLPKAQANLAAPTPPNKMSDPNISVEDAVRRAFALHFPETVGGNDGPGWLPQAQASLAAPTPPNGMSDPNISVEDSVRRAFALHFPERAGGDQPLKNSQPPPADVYALPYSEAAKAYPLPDKEAAYHALPKLPDDEPGLDDGLINALGAIWNAPNTLLGTALGFAGVPFGAGVNVDNNAIQFTQHLFMIPGGAITIGNAVIYGKKAGPTVIRNGTPMANHERQHTLQGQQLGPLYLPSNILGGTAGLLFNGKWHGAANWNETGPKSIPPTPWK